MLRFLCVSDIHGHAQALRAVLQEADGLGWDQLIACGDLLFPGPEPLGVWELLQKHHAVCIQGIGDRALARIDPGKLVPIDEAQRKRAERLRAIRSELGDLILARLAKLPPIVRLPLESGQMMVPANASRKT